MKPKERYLNYALLSSTASCEPVSNTVPTAFKEDIPIDLSCKSHSRTSPLHNSHHHHHHHHSGSVLDPGTLEHIIKTGTLPFSIDPTHPPVSVPYLGASTLVSSQTPESSWPIKYCYPTHPTAATLPGAHSNSVSGVTAQDGAVFPYLLLNPHHPLHQASAVRPSSTPIIHRAQHEIEASTLLPVFPYHRLTSADNFSLYNARQQIENRRLHQPEEFTSTDAGSAHSSPSSALSPNDLYRNDTGNSQLREHSSLVRSKSSESPPALSAFHAPLLSTAPIKKRSHSEAPTSGRRGHLKKSNSYPNLPKHLSRPLPAARILAKRLHKVTSLRRAKSEDCLHRIKYQIVSTDNSNRSTTFNNLSSSTANMNSISVKNIQQKRLSDCDNKNHEFEKENNVTVQQNNSKSRFHRHFRKEVIESWDNENKQANANNALDLTRASPPLKKLSSDLNSLDSFREKLHSPDSAVLQDVKQPLPLPLDIYRQYYYYLMHEPAFASRAAAVAMAETYAKLLSPSRVLENGNVSENLQTCMNDSINANEICDDTGKAFTMVHLNSDIKLKSPPISPDFIMNVNGKTELRSADTTNGGLPCFDRKRISRPLTGKHVRHGTGASPSTLVTLRNMIQQRQKLREIGRLDQNNRFSKAKNNKRIKRK